MLRLEYLSLRWEKSYCIILPRVLYHLLRARGKMIQLTTHFECLISSTNVTLCLFSFLSSCSLYLTLYYTFKNNKIYPVIKAGKNILKKVDHFAPVSPTSGRRYRRWSPWQERLGGDIGDGRYVYRLGGEIGDGCHVYRLGGDIGDGCHLYRLGGDIGDGRYVYRLGGDIGDGCHVYRLVGDIGDGCYVYRLGGDIGDGCHEYRLVGDIGDGCYVYRLVGDIGDGCHVYRLVGDIGDGCYVYRLVGDIGDGCHVYRLVGDIGDGRHCCHRGYSSRAIPAVLILRAALINGYQKI